MVLPTWPRRYSAEADKLCLRFVDNLCLHPHEAPRDANQPDLVADYELLGCTVVDLGSIGEGVSDLLIGCAGITDLAEVKMPGKELRSNQVEFNGRWRGSKPWKVQSRDDVIAHIADMRRRARHCGGAPRNRLCLHSGA
jgi:hypothetical protein